MSKPNGETSFRAGDSEYTLLFDIDALCALEDRTGQGVMKIASTMANPDEVRFSMVLDMLWAGLQPKHKATADEAKAIANELGVIETMKIVAEAFSAAFPTEEAAPSRKAAPVPLTVKPAPSRSRRTG